MKIWCKIGPVGVSDAPYNNANTPLKSQEVVKQEEKNWGE